MVPHPSTRTPTRVKIRYPLESQVSDLTRVVAVLITVLSLVNCQPKSYDQDLALQATVLKDAYPSPFTTDQLTKVRSFAKDPEMMRSYLLDLSNERVAKERKELSDKTIQWLLIQSFYESWLPPSPANRQKYAKTQSTSEKEGKTSGQRSETFIEHYNTKSVDLHEIRNEIVNKGFGSFDGRDGPYVEAALGFTGYRMEGPDGKGITFRLTQDGLGLPLLQDDFR